MLRVQHPGPGSVNISKCTLGDKVILTEKSPENKTVKVTFVKGPPTL